MRVTSCRPSDGDTMNEVTIWAVFVAVIGVVNPEAAAGAVCGSLFFWSLSPEIPISQRILLAIASIGFGYGIALPAARSEEWSAWTWIVAGGAASMAHVVIVSLREMVKGGSPLPPWLVAIFDLLPWRKNRGE